MNEVHVIEAIQRGDTEQFGFLYDAYFGKIYAYLFYRVREKATVEDLVSATFFKAIDRFKSFDPQKGNFSAWLYRIARNTLFDHHRMRKFDRPLDDIENMSDGLNVERNAALAERLGKVKELMKNLSPAEREIITLRVWDDLSYAEIGEIVGKGEATSKVSFHRAMRKLKKSMPTSFEL